MRDHLPERPGEDFADWAEPLIVDRLSEVYQAAFSGDPLRAKIFVALHVRVWCAVIGGDVEHGMQLRKELLNEYKGIDQLSATLVRADKAVATELHEVIRRRFRTSRRLAAAYVTPLHLAVQYFRPVTLAA